MAHSCPKDCIDHATCELRRVREEFKGEYLPMCRFYKPEPKTPSIPDIPPIEEALIQQFTWNNDTMAERIMREFNHGRDREILAHFETDYTELREFLEAKRSGKDLVAVVRCGECIHRHTRPNCQGRQPDWFCAGGEGG